MLASEFIPPSLLISSNLVALWLLQRAARQVAWSALTPVEIRSWLAYTIAVLIAWQLQVSVNPGIEFHLSGATLLTLIAGPWRALLGMAALLIMTAAFSPQTQDAFSGLGLNLLLNAALPIACTQGLLRLAQSRLPHNYFIFIFINSFAAAGLSMLILGISQCVLLVTLTIYSSDFVLNAALPFYFLMAWPEAFITGLTISLLVVWAPGTVSSFNDRQYLRKP
ncbi:energy-coupling factor ABC transporter permease [Deefgea salmonis]|uniref:Energy-coupling factor ABC transporter permease n=1 Tax=Deefgea salmonis TaxID=2875502 RepID=A0ABS8BGQ8_9NEIS|nr:energy-coupling factor ABC transporter permease [Deefgea salmonis]MCB5194812.1 energy-coupling factor ABC transporter permease [Deefgea salmonis]